MCSQHVIDKHQQLERSSQIEEDTSSKDAELGQTVSSDGVVPSLVVVHGIFLILVGANLLSIGLVFS
jgi:hypothetical protein